MEDKNVNNESSASIGAYYDSKEYNNRMKNRKYLKNAGIFPGILDKNRVKINRVTGSIINESAKNVIEGTDVSSYLEHMTALAKYKEYVNDNGHTRMSTTNMSSYNS